MTIFDLITSSKIVAYWEIIVAGQPPFLGEELFPSQQKLGLKLDWLKGSKGLPVVLKLSAFDVKAVPRKRMGFSKLEAEMPFFKESKYIDEELRQQLNMVMETGNQVYIDAVVNRIFDDEMELLEAARAQRERMRMMLVTSGVIALESNGQNYEWDYGMPEDHKVTVSKSWSDPSAPIVDDVRAGIDKIEEDTGMTITRAICNNKTFGYLRINTQIRTSINPENPDKFISDAKIIQFFQDELDIQIVRYNKQYKDEKEKAQKYIPDETFVMFPSGNLGNTWFGTTPEQSDLMSNQLGNGTKVTITDTGVAVTTMAQADPVTVETKVTMICLPDCPNADMIYIIDTQAD